MSMIKWGAEQVVFRCRNTWCHLLILHTAFHGKFLPCRPEVSGAILKYRRYHRSISSRCHLPTLAHGIRLASANRLTHNARSRPCPRSTTHIILQRPTRQEAGTARHVVPTAALTSSFRHLAGPVVVPIRSSCSPLAGQRASRRNGARRPQAQNNNAPERRRGGGPLLGRWFLLLAGSPEYQLAGTGARCHAGLVDAAHQDMSVFESYPRQHRCDHHVV